MKYEPTEKGLRDALAALGADVADVAKSLQDRGVRGRRGDSCRCPIAQYLTDVMEREPYVSDAEVQLLVDESDPNNLTWITVDSPAAVRDFIAGFDHGVWPELVLS